MEAQLVFVHVTDVLPQDAHQHPQLALQRYFGSKTTLPTSCQEEVEAHLKDTDEEFKKVVSCYLIFSCYLLLALLSLLKCSLGVVVSLSGTSASLLSCCILLKSHLMSPL